MAEEHYTIERIHVKDISPEAFEFKYVNRGMPVVLEGLLDDWPAKDKWTLEYFRDTHGDVDVTVETGGHRGPKETLKLGAFISNFAEYERTAAATGTPPPYLRVWNFLEDCPELEADFDAEKYFPDHFRKLPAHLRPPFTWLFFGPTGVFTSLHSDIWDTDAWLCNLVGSKRFTAYHPSHRKHLEVDGAFVDLQAPDLAKYPDFPKATPIKFVLGPGECVYIPRRWPHYAISTSPSISLTTNFMARCNKKTVLPLLEPYMSRRIQCEKLLQRPLRSSDNLMKYCCHGGKINLQAAKQVMGAALAVMLARQGEGEGESDSEDDEGGEGEQPARFPTSSGREAGRWCPDGQGLGHHVPHPAS